jgi:hypothetical protein
VARIRTIKPEFFQSEELAGLSPHARLLAIALLQLVDSEGRMRWISMQVHAHAFPFEPDLDIEALTQEIEAIGYIVRYEVCGKPYAYVPGFTVHQRLSGKEAALKSLHPPPPSDAGGKDQGKSTRFPGKHPDAQEGEEEQGIGKGSGRGTRAHAPLPGEATEITAEPDDLAGWLNDSAMVLDDCPFLASPRERRSVFSQYGPPGMSPNAWRRPDGTSVPEPERPRLLALALTRYVSEGHKRLVGNEFDGMLRRVIVNEGAAAAPGEKPLWA